MKGFVYIISNPSIHGQIKIGYSLKDPIERAKELATTGVPTAYIVDYEALVDNPYEVEQVVHSAISDFNIGKEWFNCDHLRAVSEIRKAANIIYFENISFKIDGSSLESIEKDRKIFSFIPKITNSAPMKSFTKAAGTALGQKAGREIVNLLLGKGRKK